MDLWFDDFQHTRRKGSLKVFVAGRKLHEYCCAFFTLTAHLVVRTFTRVKLSRLDQPPSEKPPHRQLIIYSRKDIWPDSWFCALIVLSAEAENDDINCEQSVTQTHSSAKLQSRNLKDVTLNKSAQTLEINLDFKVENQPRSSWMDCVG